MPCPPLTLLYSKKDQMLLNSSDGRVVKVSASGAVDSGLISSRAKPMTSKLVCTASLLDAQHLKGQCREQAGKLTYCVVGKGA